MSCEACFGLWQFVKPAFFDARQLIAVFWLMPLVGTRCSVVVASSFYPESSISGFALSLRLACHITAASTGQSLQAIYAG